MNPSLVNGTKFLFPRSFFQLVAQSFPGGRENTLSDFFSRRPDSSGPISFPAERGVCMRVSRRRENHSGFPFSLAAGGKFSSGFSRKTNRGGPVRSLHGRGPRRISHRREISGLRDSGRTVRKPFCESRTRKTPRKNSERAKVERFFFAEWAKDRLERE